MRPWSSEGPDHPHAGGENGRRQCRITSLHGPSPRGWGERRRVGEIRRRNRTIPTRVGRTSWGWPRGRSRADHPHAGGENLPRLPGAGSYTGPSPRGWGEPLRYPLPHLVWRTIPTRVGRTAVDESCEVPLADHPHAGGENRDTTRMVCLRSGPSPRGWGERGRWRARRGAGRTIPTRVGRTLSSGVAMLVMPDHPHAGGENEREDSQAVLQAGPSPRGWGELRRVGSLVGQRRTIPTRVGRTRGGRDGKS